MIPDGLLTLVGLIGATQGVVLATAFFSLGRKERGDRLLALMLLGGAVAVGAVLLSHRAELARLHFALELIEYSLWFFIGPVFYLYVHAVTGDSSRPTLALHLLPGAGWLVYVAAAAAGAAGIVFPHVLAMMGYQLLYTALSIQRLVDLWSPERPTGHHRFWSRAWVAVLLAQHGAQLLRYLMRRNPAFDDVVPLVGAVGFFILTFVGFRNSRLLAPGRARRRSSGPRMPAERAARIAQAVREALDGERRFLEAGLTLEGLAADLRVPRAQLSQAVNEHLGRGFLELVNGYRVREAQRLLDDPQTSHLTVEAIAFRSGFNSRSAFYQAFRRQTGMTPTRYRDAQAARGGG